MGKFTNRDMDVYNKLLIERSIIHTYIDINMYITYCAFKHPENEMNF